MGGVAAEPIRRHINQKRLTCAERTSLLSKITLSRDDNCDVRHQTVFAQNIKVVQISGKLKF